MKDSIRKVLTIVIIVLMQLLLVNWNTNSFLMKWDEPIAVEDAWRTSHQGRRAIGELDTVTTLEQIQEKSYTNLFFFQAEELEPIGIYKLLSSDYEGTVYVGRTFNIFPRSIYTTGTFLPKVYRGMYGQFYKATLSDGSNVLVLIGCNDEEQFLKEGYGDVLAGYSYGSIKQLDEKRRKEVPDRLEEIEEQMDISGYISMGDTDWAKRHELGVFMMNALKFLLSAVVAGLVVGYMTVFIWKDKPEGEEGSNKREE